MILCYSYYHYIACQVLLLALELMPDGYTFNVSSFGTGFNEAFPRAIKKSDKSLEKAKRFILVSEIIPCLSLFCLGLYLY